MELDCKTRQKRQLLYMLTNPANTLPSSKRKRTVSLLTSCVYLLEIERDSRQKRQAMRRRLKANLGGCAIYRFRPSKTPSCMCINPPLKSRSTTVAAATWLGMRIGVSGGGSEMTARKHWFKQSLCSAKKGLFGRESGIS